jgi:hypothetical protein
MISKDDLMSLARAVTFTVGAELVRRGLTSDGVVEAATGAVTIIAGIVWMWLKNRAEKKKKAAEIAAAKAELPPGAVMPDGIATVPGAEAGVTWCGPCK